MASSDVDIKCPPYCNQTRKRCTIKHHPLLVALLNCQDDDRKEVMDIRLKQLETVVNKHKQSRVWNFSSNIPDPDPVYNFPMIHWACALGRVAAVKWLIGHRVDKYKLDSDGDTALHRALLCLQDAHPKNASAKFTELLPLLVHAIPMQNKEGNTPFHVACQMLLKEMPKVEYFADCIAKMIDHQRLYGKDKLVSLLNSQNNEGDTAVHILSQHDRNFPAVNSLVELDMDINIRNSKGLTPLDVALEKGQMRLSAYFGKLSQSTDMASVETSRRQPRAATKIIMGADGEIYRYTCSCACSPTVPSSCSCQKKGRVNSPSRGSPRTQSPSGSLGTRDTVSPGRSGFARNTNSPARGCPRTQSPSRSLHTKKERDSPSRSVLARNTSSSRTNSPSRGSLRTQSPSRSGPAKTTNDSSKSPSTFQDTATPSHGLQRDTNMPSQNQKARNTASSTQSGAKTAVGPTRQSVGEDLVNSQQSSGTAMTIPSTRQNQGDDASRDVSSPKAESPCHDLDTVMDKAGPTSSGAATERQHAVTSPSEHGQKETVDPAATVGIVKKTLYVSLHDVLATRKLPKPEASAAAPETSDGTDEKSLYAEKFTVVGTASNLPPLASKVPWSPIEEGKHESNQTEIEEQKEETISEKNTINTFISKSDSPCKIRIVETKSFQDFEPFLGSSQHIAKMRESSLESSQESSIDSCDESIQSEDAAIGGGATAILNMPVASVATTTDIQALSKKRKISDCEGESRFSCSQENDSSDLVNVIRDVRQEPTQICTQEKELSEYIDGDCLVKRLRVDYGEDKRVYPDTATVNKKRFKEDTIRKAGERSAEPAYDAREVYTIQMETKDVFEDGTVTSQGSSTSISTPVGTFNVGIDFRKDSEQGTAFLQFLRNCMPDTQKSIRQTILKDKRVCEEQIAYLDRQQSALKAQLEKSQKEQEKLVENISDLLHQLARLQNREGTIKTQVADFQNQVQNARSALTGLRERLQHCESALRVLQNLL